MKTEKVLQKVKGQIDRLEEQGMIRYRTKDLEELKDTSKNDPQQAVDRKMLAEELETLLWCRRKLDQLMGVEQALMPSEEAPTEEYPEE